MEYSLKPHTVIVWVGLVILHLALLFTVVYTPIFQGTLLNEFGLTVVIVPYLFAIIGLPVLIESSGWVTLPGPNLLGWILSIAVWLLFYWYIAKLIMHLINKFKQ